MKLIGLGSVRTRLVLSTVVVALPVIFLVVLILGSISAYFAANASKQRLASDEISTANAVQQWDHYFVLAMQNLRAQPQIAGMNPSDQLPLLAQLKKTYDQIEIAQVTAPTGLTQARTDGARPVDDKDRPWFKACMAGQPVVRQAMITSTGQPALNISMPIQSASGKMVGVLSTITDLSSLGQQFGITSDNSDEQTFVVDDRGNALVYPTMATATQLCDLSDYPPVSEAFHGKSGIFAYTDVSGISWFANIAQLPNGWCVVTQMPQNAVMAQGNFLMKTACWIGGIALALIALFSWFTSTRFARPIGALISAANDLARGIWSRRVDFKRGDELGRLGAAFDRMAGHLEIGYRHIEDEVKKRTAELKNTNAALHSAVASADTANRAKSEFLANMSHEIRTPISAIVGFTDIMLDPIQSQSDRLDGLQVIRRNAQHLLELINNILDLSKIEAGKMKVEEIVCDLPGLLCGVASMMQPRAIEKSLRLAVSLETPIPKQVRTDPLRVRQILVNLIGNAIKFSESGCVEVRAALESINGSRQILKFSVTDTGIGMTQEQIGRLFQAFTQADGSTTRRFGGTGLGLTISKRFVEMLGGQISVTSRSGNGTTISFTVSAGREGTETVAAVQENQEPTTSDQPLPMIHGRILLAEDGQDNQRFIAAMLRKAGAHVEIADNGRIALEKAMSEPFDMIFMDMQMPEMDGYQAASELRIRGCKLPIIALTAHAMAEDKSKCLQAGCTGYLTKPIDRRKLLATAAESLTGHTEPAPTATPAGAASPQTHPTPLPAGPMIVSRFASDPDMAEIVAEFIAGLPEKVKTISALLQEQDAQRLRQAVHQLKGAGGSYGFDSLSKAAAEAEAPLREGKSLEDARQGIEKMIQMIRSVGGYDKAKETTRA